MFIFWFVFVFVFVFTYTPFHGFICDYSLLRLSGPWDTKVPKIVWAGPAPFWCASSWKKVKYVRIVSWKQTLLNSPCFASCFKSRTYVHWKLLASLEVLKYLRISWRPCGRLVPKFTNICVNTYISRILCTYFYIVKYGLLIVSWGNSTFRKDAQLSGVCTFTTRTYNF